MKFTKKLFLLPLVLLSVAGLSSCGGSTASTSEGPALTLGGWNTFDWVYQNAEGAETTTTYSLYLPASYDASKSYPLISYIGDSTYVGKKSTYSANKGQCTKNWISEENMSANPCMFLTFTFKDGASTPTDETSEGGQVNRIIDDVCSKYAVNTNRLYLTGQSMGGIFDFAMNDAYPEKYAATVYVSCQMGGEVGNEQYNTILENGKFASQKFVYIASAKDGKAPYGQKDVMATLDAKGVAYTYLKDLDHKDIAATNTLVKAELDKGLNCNIFQFKQVTSNGDATQEHMQAFEYAYEINSIFTWLVSQSK